MSARQRAEIDAILRHGALDVGGDVETQRAVFAEMMRATPVPDDVATTSDALGGVPVVTVEVDGASGTGVLLHVHGGAFAIGSAELSVGLAADLARRAGVRAVAVDYRLAPEHPHPAAVRDVVAAYAGLLHDVPATQVAFVGESAGGGLVAAALLALRDAGCPLPAAAVLMSPWVDLTLSGATMTTRAAADPALTADGLRRRAVDYVASGDPTDELVSPVFADLRGLPPLLVQAGSHEILLDDALRLAGRAAAADVAVTLQVVPGVPHVFQAFAPVLEEGDAALTAAARFLGGHLAAGTGEPAP